MKLSQSSGLLVAAMALIAGVLVATNVAHAQQEIPPQAGPGGFPGQGGFGGPGPQGMPPGMPGMMGPMGGGQMQVINDPGMIYIIRGDRITRIDKAGWRVAGELQLPMPGMMRPMPPGAGGVGGGTAPARGGGK